jgi:hypothetical protein
MLSFTETLSKAREFLLQNNSTFRYAVVWPSDRTPSGWGLHGTNDLNHAAHLAEEFGGAVLRRRTYWTALDKNGVVRQ